MHIAKTIVENINFAIDNLIKTDTFTLDDIHKIMIQKWPRTAPSKKSLINYLRWPKIHANKFNGKYFKDNGGRDYEDDNRQSIWNPSIHTRKP